MHYTEEALQACVTLTGRYVTDRYFPDKAIDALDEAFGKNVCALDDKPTNGEFIALVADRLGAGKSA